MLRALRIIIYFFRCIFSVGMASYNQLVKRVIYNYTIGAYCIGISDCVVAVCQAAFLKVYGITKYTLESIQYEIKHVIVIMHSFESFKVVTKSAFVLLLTREKQSKRISLLTEAKLLVIR